MQISIVMPAYNEQENIEDTVHKCFKVLEEIPGTHEVVVTNDGSKDFTGDILNKLTTQYDNLVIAVNSPNQGYGVALEKAIQHSSGNVVVSIDSDGQFDISELSGLLDKFDSSIDILTGYRVAKQDSWFRVFADRVMNLMIRVMFQVSYKDTNCAFKLYRGDVIREMNLETSGFQIPTEIVLKAHAEELSVHETPVHHTQREGGASALAPFKTAFNMFVFLIYLRLKIALFRRKIIRRL